jgi:hypothetical protein
MNLSQLNSSDIRQVLALRKQIEALEDKMLAIVHNAQKRKPSEAAALRGLARRQQPSLRELITTILKQAKKPMSVQDIYEGSLVAGYHWRSQEPINALNVKMYTDKTFKKVSPGRFVLRKGT